MKSKKANKKYAEQLEGLVTLIKHLDGLSVAVNRADGSAKLFVLDGGCINWQLLRQQRNKLFDIVKASSGATADAGEGLMNLLDWFVDEAAKQLGDDVVFPKKGPSSK